MEQKEVLIIVGVLVVGFFLLNNNGMLSGKSVYNNYLTYPNQIGSNIKTYAYTPSTDAGPYVRQSDYAGWRSKWNPQPIGTRFTEEENFCACPAGKGEIILEDCPKQARNCYSYFCKTYVTRNRTSITRQCATEV